MMVTAVRTAKRAIRLRPAKQNFACAYASPCFVHFFAVLAQAQCESLYFTFC